MPNRALAVYCAFLEDITHKKDIGHTCSDIQHQACNYWSASLSIHTGMNSCSFSLYIGTLQATDQADEIIILHGAKQCQVSS
jgi:hypothetical protein